MSSFFRAQNLYTQFTDPFSWHFKIPAHEMQLQMASTSAHHLYGKAVPELYEPATARVNDSKLTL
jgi:hypothetical protein